MCSYICIYTPDQFTELTWNDPRWNVVVWFNASHLANRHCRNWSEFGANFTCCFPIIWYNHPVLENPVFQPSNATFALKIVE